MFATPRPLVLVAAASITASACGSGSSSEPSAAPTTVAVTTTDSDAAADPAMASTTAPTSTAASTTTITPPDPIPATPPDGMELVWSDEFDGDAIDTTNWTYDIGGWGWGNGEAQYYTDRTDNARVENGLLHIELREERIDENYYTSARMKTQGLREFQYGRIEARIKVPKGKGTWPAFWMLGAEFDPDSDDPDKQWPTVGEIDVMEYVGREPDLVLGTVHGPGYSGAGGKSGWFRQEFEIGDDFHTFAIDWDAEGIWWFFDGEQYHEVTPDGLGRGEWVFDQPFFIIVNLALGGTLGGLPALDLEYPIHYYVDFVRVYQTRDEEGE